MNEELLQKLRHPMHTIGYAETESNQPGYSAATAILDVSNTAVMGEAADAIERLTAENEMLLAENIMLKMMLEGSEALRLNQQQLDGSKE